MSASSSDTDPLLGLGKDICLHSKSQELLEAQRAPGLAPREGMSQRKGWVWERHGADGAALVVAVAVQQKSPRWDVGGCTTGGDRDVDSPSVVQKKEQIHSFLADKSFS